MRILEKQELLKHDKSKFENLYGISKIWLESSLIEKKQYDELIYKIRHLNYKHHNEANFEKNFIELFSVEKNGEKLVNTLDRANMGANFGGIELSKNNTLFTETAEMGIIILLSTSLNKEQIEEAIEGIDFLMFALEDPLLAKKQIEVLNNKNKLESNLILKKEEKRVKI